MEFVHLLPASPHRLHTPSTQRRVLGIRSNIWQILPAAAAFAVGGFLDDGGEIAAAGDLEFAEDEEFVERGGFVEDGVVEAFGGQGERDGGFEVGTDLLFLAGLFDGLLNDAADLEQLVHRERGIATGEGRIGLREGLEVDAVGVAEMFPGFVGGEGEHGGEETAERLGDLADGGLCGDAARAGGGIAVHAVFGDVDVEGAEVSGDEAVDDAEDLAEVVVRICIHAFFGDGVEALEDPAVHQSVSGL